jgi:hypothetical protein
MKKLTMAATALFFAGQLHAGNNPDSSNSEMLGMLDSPLAFAELCGDLADPDSEVSKALQTLPEGPLKAGSAEELGFVATSISGVACSAIIRGVFETIAMAKDYQTVNGQRICLPEMMPVAEVALEARRIAKEQPDLVAGKQNASALVLYIALQKGVCP